MSHTAFPLVFYCLRAHTPSIYSHVYLTTLMLFFFKSYTYMYGVCALCCCVIHFNSIFHLYIFICMLFFSFGAYALAFLCVAIEHLSKFCVLRMLVDLSHINCFSYFSSMSQNTYALWCRCCWWFLLICERVREWKANAKSTTFRIEFIFIYFILFVFQFLKSQLDACCTRIIKYASVNLFS